MPLALQYGPQHVYDEATEILGYPPTWIDMEEEDEQVAEFFGVNITHNA